MLTNGLAIAGAVALLAACRPDTVSLDARPEVGDTYTIRYDIDAEVTSVVEGQAPETTTLSTRLDTEQVVAEVDAEGTVVSLTVRADGGPTQRLRVRLDRAGSLAAVEQVEGLPAGAFGLGPDSLLPSSAGTVPRGPVRIGDEWDLGQRLDAGGARLVGLGRIDGAEVATVHADLLQRLDEVATVVGSEVALTGSLRSTATTTYDLADGSVRRATSRTSGTVDALVQPPRGVEALPVPAVITIDLRVRATRLP